MASSTTGTADRFVDAVSETSAAVNERVKSGIERAHRITSTLYGEVERAQQDALELGRKVLSDPADIVGISGLAYEKASAAQDRVFEFARNFVDEAATSTRETRSAVERVARANLEASRPAVETVRDLVARTGEALRPAFLRNQAPEPVPAPRARRTAAEDAA